MEHGYEKFQGKALTEWKRNRLYITSTFKALKSNDLYWTQEASYERSASKTKKDLSRLFIFRLAPELPLLAKTGFRIKQGLRSGIAASEMATTSLADFGVVERMEVPDS